MKKIIDNLTLMLGLLLLFSCTMRKDKKESESNRMFTGQDGEIKLVILDPGHFHASLLQKFPQKQVSDTVLVYAPQGNELNQYLASIEGYNHRSENPTNWNEAVYSSADYLEKMMEEKRGNVVILAGNPITSINPSKRDIMSFRISPWQLIQKTSNCLSLPLTVHVHRIFTCTM